ncbi:septum formation inhibitor Maf [Gracilibacillus oryzae]|uniref:dTTP/UTP pyrophosphatase n=1 Tax=Gracilibacillus oryzae TaxID=1672701 RepID=A0A7C8L7J2_9BACI|nr:Maf family protein [Gracilibacillus oryzae]KAB8137489.1 septum formation inhibitor Maf [Gracilibacillus oryzae]
MTKQLILASSSPRRQEILKQVKIPFTIKIPDVDESQIVTDDPYEKVEQLAKIKGSYIPIENDNNIIISADTVVAFQNKIFEKPKDKEEARAMIRDLSGDVHSVYTGVMIRSQEKEFVFVERTEVEFWPLSAAEIDSYIATEEPYDKAGAYGIQSVGAMFVKRIVGDYYNVVGLPISRVLRELKGF